ncbi:unnamed protein product [Closterium sp. NIES-54]
MVGAVGDAGVVDTLEARLEDARRCHEANEYGPNLPLAVIEAGIRSVWAEEHPARPASPRLVNNEGGVDVGVNAGGDQVGNNAGGTSRQRGVIHADEVGGVLREGCCRQRLQPPRKATSEDDEAVCRQCRRPTLAAVVAVARSRQRTPTRSRPRIAVVEEEVDVRSAGCAATPTTFPLSAPTAVTPTTTSPREVAGGLAAVVPVEAETSHARRSLYFLLLKDRKTRYVWVRPDAKKSDALQEFVQWLVVTERQTKKSVLMLRSDRGGEFLGKQFTDFVNGKGIVHDLTCPYTPQQNGMAEREMRTVVESVLTMLLHMGVQHHWWHLALRQAVWGCMAQFFVPEHQHGGKLKPKARWDLHLSVLEESKGWELLDIADNWVVTTSDVVFYENMSLEVWKSEHGPALSRTPTTPPMDTSTATLPLLAEVGEPAAEDIEDVPFPFPSLAPCAPPLVADLRRLTSVSASSDEGRIGTSPSAPAKSIAGGRHDEQQVDVGVKSTLIGRSRPRRCSLLKQSAGKLAVVQQDDEGSEAGDDGGYAEESTDSGVVEVQRRPWQTGRIQRLPDFYVPAAFTTTYDEVDVDLQVDDTEEDENFPELDPDMHADPEHRWDILTMTVKEALASWKGKAVKAAMEEEICNLVCMGTWELVERPPGVNIMKNRWVLMTKYHIDDTVEREKARLVVKGFTQVYGTGYHETYALVISYVTLRIFLSIVAVLDLNLMQLDMKNAFLQSKLDRVLNMYQPDYFNDGAGQVCKLLKSLYGLKHSPLLSYRAIDGVLLGAGLKKSQVDTALYFKVGDDKVTCWVLVYVDDLLAASSSAAMLKELLKAAFELREISPVQKYLTLEIVHDRSVRKLWLHQQGYANKLRRRFLDDKHNGRTPKTLLDAGTPIVLRLDNKLAITITEGMGLTGNLKHMERRQAWLQHMVKRGKFLLSAAIWAGGPSTNAAGESQRELLLAPFLFGQSRPRVGVEVTPVEDTATSTRRPRPASPPDFPSVLLFPPRSSLQPVVAEPGGVLAGGTGGPGGVSGGGAGSGGAGAGGAGTVVSTPRTVLFLTHEQRLLWLEREECERFERAIQQYEQQEQSQSQQQESVEEESQKQQERAEEFSRPQQQVQLQPQGVTIAVAGAAAAAAGEGRGGATGAAVGAGTTVADARGGGAEATASARPARPSTCMLGSWSHAVPSCSPRLVPFLVPVDSSLSPQSCCLSIALSVSLPCRRPVSPSLVTTVAGFSSSHRLDYTAHLVSGPARSPSSGGAPVFPLEVLEDRQFELCFLVATFPHPCAMLLAPEGDPDALDIPIPHTHAEAVLGPWASYWIAAEEAEMGSYRSIGTCVDGFPPPGTNVVNG